MIDSSVLVSSDDLGSNHISATYCCVTSDKVMNLWLLSGESNNSYYCLQMF